MEIPKRLFCFIAAMLLATTLQIARPVEAPAADIDFDTADLLVIVLTVNGVDFLVPCGPDVSVMLAVRACQMAKQGFQGAVDERTADANVGPCTAPGHVIGPNGYASRPPPWTTTNRTNLRDGSAAHPTTAPLTRSTMAPLA